MEHLNETSAQNGTSVLNTVFTFSLAALIFVLTLGLGATLSLDSFKQAMLLQKKYQFGCLKGKKMLSPAPVCGFLSQFVFMPVIALVFGLSFQFTPYLALGLLITGCCPGGSTSNFFTFLVNGDVALSITMTVISTVTAIGMIPAWIALASPLLFAPNRTSTYLTYLGEVVEVGSGGEGEGADLSINVVQWLGSVAQSLALVIVPVIIGVVIRWKSERVAKIIEKVGTVTGIIFITAALIVGTIDNQKLFLSGWQVWVAGFALEPLGMALGAGFAFLFRLPKSQISTIALETGVQNSTLAIAIINFTLMSAPNHIKQEALVLPLIYSLALVVDSGIFAAVGFSIVRCNRRRRMRGGKSRSKRGMFAALSSTSITTSMSDMSGDNERAYRPAKSSGRVMEEEPLSSSSMHDNL
mmetsp:Transcript_40614/g.105434  ORF Transcript_40614/g.105434 Transcript_40614/m.105434 type:complete len:412 (-) Transcript_40614:116-1351(-)